MATDNPTESYWLCPLYSFDCASESVDLVEGLQIKHTIPGLGEYFQKHARDLYGRWDDPSEYKGVVLLPYKAKFTKGTSIEEKFLIGFEEHDRANNLLLDLVTALRLCHEGRIAVGPLILAITSDSGWSVGNTESWTRVSENDFLHKEPKYILRQSDIPEVKNLLQDIRKWRETRVLDAVDIALRRSHSSYHGDIEDRIIDQMIAFESLYLGSEQELTYKLASRAAFLLRKRKDYRILIFNNLKKAYNYRSRIVHGDNPPSRKELRAIVPKTEDYLRQSIRKFLKLLASGYSLDTLKKGKDNKPAILDENILKNGALLA